jgi:hypothetical protein
MKNNTKDQKYISIDEYKGVLYIAHTRMNLSCNLKNTWLVLPVSDTRTRLEIRLLMEAHGGNIENLLYYNERCGWFYTDIMRHFSEFCAKAPVLL